MAGQIENVFKTNCGMQFVLQSAHKYQRKPLFVQGAQRRQPGLGELSLRSGYCKTEIETELWWVEKQKISAAECSPKGTIPSKWIWRQMLQDWYWILTIEYQPLGLSSSVGFSRNWFDLTRGNKAWLQIFLNISNTNAQHCQ